MTETDRALLAERITAERRSQYGTKSAAYQAAGINSGTWDKIELGDPTVREDRLTAAVKSLWPASGGDWRIALATEPASASLAQELPEDADTLSPSQRRLVLDVVEQFAALNRALAAHREDVTGNGPHPAPTTPARDDLASSVTEEASEEVELDPGALGRRRGRSPRRKPQTE